MSVTKRTKDRVKQHSKHWHTIPHFEDSVFNGSGLLHGRLCRAFSCSGSKSGCDWIGWLPVDELVELHLDTQAKLR